MKKLSLMEVLEGIEDTRRGRSVWYCALPEKTDSKNREKAE